MKLMKHYGQDKYFMKLMKYYGQDKYFMNLMKYYGQDKYFMDLMKYLNKGRNKNNKNNFQTCRTVRDTLTVKKEIIFGQSKSHLQSYSKQDALFFRFQVQASQLLMMSSSSKPV